MNWLVKYKPSKLHEFIGNKNVITKLRCWIQSFLKKKNKYHLVCLYGPSGIGKTLLSYLIFKEYSYICYELNAGDIRSRKRMEEVLNKLWDYKPISFFESSEKLMGILMDEIDGMSCGDKGGFNLLVEMIESRFMNKQPLIPVICTSNRSLDLKSTNCVVLELRLVPPSKKELLQFLENICISEHITYSLAVLENIIHKCKDDIRQCIMQLHLYSLTQKSKLSPVVQNDKSYHNTIFDICENIIRTYPIDMNALWNKLRYDINLIPSMIQENIYLQLNTLLIQPLHFYTLYFQSLYCFVLGDNLESCIQQHDHQEIIASCLLLKVVFFLNSIHLLPKKKNAPAEIQFTSNLSKSATLLNNHSMMLPYVYIFDTTIYELPYYIEYIYNMLVLKKTDKIKEFTRCLTKSDLEKIFIFYTYDEFKTKKKFNLKQYFN